MINFMRLITNIFFVRCFFLTALLMGSYNFMGQSVSFTYVQSYFGVTQQDATWVFRGFQAGTIITSIAGLVFVKWLGNRPLFIGAAFLLLLATISSFSATTFNVLIVSRIAAGIANGFIIAVSTQLYLATYEGKAKIVGSMNPVAANVGGVCLGLMINGSFTEDYGWQFTYYLTLPVLVAIIIFSFFFVPRAQRNEELEEDWISLIPFTILIISIFFLVLFQEQYQGLSNFKMLLAAILAVVSASVLLARGFLHKKPLFDTHLLLYPAFIIALIIAYLSGAAIVFNVSMLVKLLGVILQMPTPNVYHLMSFMALVIILSFIVTFILITRKFNPFWLLIIGLLAASYAVFSYSKLNTEFSLNNILTPALIAMAGSGMVGLSVIIVANKSVPDHLVGKVLNFRSVAFVLGIALTATDEGRLLNFQRVRKFNMMRAYTDPGNPLFNEQFNGLKATYQSNGYDADQAYDAAVNGMTGIVKSQSYFLGMSEIFFIGSVIALALAIAVFIIWLFRNLSNKTNVLT